MFIFIILTLFINFSFCRYKSDNEEEENQRLELLKTIKTRTRQIKDIQEGLPRSSDLYLKVVMGGINASFLDSEQKFKYKEQYERFKLIVTSIILVVCLLDIVVHYRY